MQLLFQKKLLFSVLAIVVLAGAAGTYFWFFQQQKGNDPFISLPSVNAYLQQNFGFTFRSGTFEYAPVVLVCNEQAPKNSTETSLGQFTYCQNNGNPLKVSLAWTKADVILKDYLNRIANTIMKDKELNSGNFACVEDTSLAKKNSLSGVLTDCKITVSDSVSFYYSAFFFHPPAHPEVGQVIYVYDGNGVPNGSLVKAMIRGLAGGVVF